MEIVEDSLEALWVRAADIVLTKGEKCAPRGKKTRELTGVQLVLSSPCDRIPRLPVREFSLAYAMGEMAWYLSSDDSLEFIRYYAASYGNYSDDGKRLHGAYGPRIFGKRCECSSYEHRCNAYKGSPSLWEATKAALQKDPDTRQAIIPIFQPQDPGSVTKDMPCTLSLQFMLRNGGVDLLVNMRSNDLWFGGVYDIFCFTILQELMANELGMKVGTYYHHVGSFHIYERNLADIAQCVREWGPPAFSRGLPPRIRPDQTISDLLHHEKRIRTCAPVTALEELCAQLEDWPQVPTLWELAYAAWRWKKISMSAEIKEEQRRLARGLLQDRIGLTFDRCFF